MPTTRRPPSRSPAERKGARRRLTRRGKRALLVVAAALVGAVCVLAWQILYVPPEAAVRQLPSAAEVEAAQQRMKHAFETLEARTPPSPAGVQRQAQQPRSQPSPPAQPKQPSKRRVRITEADVDAYAASHAREYSPTARDVRVQFGEGVATISAIVEMHGRPVHVTATGRLERSADGTLRGVVDTVQAGRIPLGQGAVRRLQRKVDEQLRERGARELLVEDVTMRPGEIVIEGGSPDEPAPSSP